MLKELDDSKWIDGTFKKEKSVKALLEQRVKQSPLMENFDLEYANLENINLVNTSSSKEGNTLKNSKLYKANFKYSHCFKMDFSGSSLMKADFSYANLHCANLRDCNLLGTNFKGARLENIIWDKKIIQERKAEKAIDEEEKNEYYQQAEEIYRNIRKTCENDGHFENAGIFFQKEMKMRRKKMPKYSIKRLFSKLVEISCGYGERPMRIILISSFTILLFALIYFILGIHGANGLIQYSSMANFETNFYNFLSSFYFSIVTFTTLGYGDIVPLGFTRVFVAIEALMGGFILAIFVVVFVKKMTR